ncbi:ABC transporter ATP-binding protein [Serpentinicella alkaliphila]|uniref:Putative ABC transport system ATP-binding protein n=1 Tax=Serpentinicella alkaliphila TaxID=1734049 RepID=A0A4R2T849_9FIRM|nr:ABC transporter ATP-binding protein [Serpentinicella alkaliphila]QUH25595.1 ATP-binding cassette domain-containing protein [Serpentinicella alkaliphila]TCP98375.1 putative ABC transport system ATP-binding protein [Serpentinicella alkaliphila]
MFNLYNVKLSTILSIAELHIPKGKITCIVGESGSGKSTLIKLLNKMLSPDEGEILYNSTSLRDINSIHLRREVVMLSQSPAIFPGTIKDNLLSGLILSEKKIVDDSKLVDLLGIIKLNKSLIDNAQNLSGGEKQRLALGRVLIMDPEVYLLDEPSSALDEETEEIIIKRLVEHTRNNNKTLIMVTHSKRVAELFSDIIIEIKDGKILSWREL